MGGEGPLGFLSGLPAVGVLFQGTPVAVAVKVLGTVLGAWVAIALLRRLLSGSDGSDAKRAQALVREGRYEAAGDLHAASGRLQAAVHLYERAGAYGKAARAARKLGQETVAARFFERAGEVEVAGAPAAASVPVEVAGRGSSAPAGRSQQPSASQAPASPFAGAVAASGVAAAPTQILPRQIPHDAPAPPPPAAEASDEQSERYAIDREIGRGGMAVVYRARDAVLDRIVALKFLNDPSGHAESARIFLREAQVAAALNHANIITVYDVGVLGGRPFIAMELVEGQDVASILESRGRLPVSEAVWIALRAADALGYAHRRHVVHRDVKPSNLMVTAEGTLKVMDFGLARAFDGMRRSTQVSGTPAYMAPEQFVGVVVDGRADIFSLGVTFYEMLTGELPFEGLDRLTPPVPPSVRTPGVPSAIDAVVLHVLAPRAEDRVRTAEDFAAALEAAYGAACRTP